MIERQIESGEAMSVRGTSAQKLRELEEHLGDGGKAFTLPPEVSLASLTGQLFKKAQPDLLHSRNLDELALIGIQSAKALAEHLASDKDASQPRITTLLDAGRCSLNIVLRDRPFIVRSVTDCARVFGCNVTLYLHPIVSVGSTKLSLSYIETEEMSEERFTLFCKSVEAVLRDVVLSTEDFSEMVGQVEGLKDRMSKRSGLTSVEKVEHKEVLDLMTWLTDGSFIFLGAASWKGKEIGTAYGIFRTGEHYREALLRETYQDISALGNGFSFTRLRVESPVHRRLRLSHFVIAEKDTAGAQVAVHSFVGILTSKAMAQEVAAIPVIRRKLRELIDTEQVDDNSYDHKYIVDTIDRMPKTEVFRLDMDSMKDVIETAIGIHSSDYTRVSVQNDPLGRGVSVLVVVPRNRFTTEIRDNIQRHLENVFHTVQGSSEVHLDLTVDPQVKIYFYLPLQESSDLPSVQVEKLEDEIARLSRTWTDNLEEKLREGELDNGDELFSRYGEAFPAEYQALHSIDDAVADLEVVRALSVEKPLQVRVRTIFNQSGPSHEVIIYNRLEEISVSRSLPIIENAGLEVLTSNSFLITPREGDRVYVHRMLVQVKGAFGTELKFPVNFSHGLEAIFLGRAENDALNSLLLTGPLTTEAVSVLRGYSCYLWQVNKFATRGAIFEALASTPAAAVKLWETFDQRFNPALAMGLDERKAKFQENLNQFRDILRGVKEITKDRILRSLAILLEHTLRTNFFQGRPVAFAIKVHSEKVDIMPLPRPLYDVFVRSPRFEGIHLRASKVARGGLRWSERSEDYRSEVLGLMKTQKVKNVLIVPSGAKGGFCLRHLPSDQNEVRKAVEACYKEFIRALLSLADNRVEGSIVHPPHTVIYDEPDPYFVVAADKGTATFSDIANGIAVNEYNFWLGDAFASGGSKGYDHKLYGITAKGAWECVKRHFHDLGIDYLNEPFTAVGIGDMSGDVFGNGLLLSDKVKLLAAFDHRHVFLDPSPDPAVSFAERKRLFEKPRSSWADYDPALISKGGGVFGRYDKEIAITPEVREALSLDESAPSVMNGEELISYLLRAQCDLLWNGGIGTYFKSASESHADVNDGTNDRVRVNASQLRARVIGEGGNLGFTQKGRIEFALAGGKINTDAIDNSAGVDLSDHEVNIKILCTQLMREGKLTVEERDQLLLDMSGEVCEAVLDHNRSHALMLSLAEGRSQKSVAYFQSLLRQMTKMNYINRALDFLPEDEELAERANKKGGLTRPELALCLAAVKMWIKEALLSSELIKDPLLKSYLLEYFPEVLQKRFKEEILKHPLGVNIIATQVTNTLVDAVGITFIHRMCLNHSVAPVTVIKCSLAAELLLGTQAIRSELSKFDNPAQNELYLEMRRHVSNSLRDACAWFLSSHGYELTLAEMVARYEAKFARLVKDTETILKGDDLLSFSALLDRYTTQGVDTMAARKLSLFPEIGKLLQIMYLALSTNVDMNTVSLVYASTMKETGLSRLFAFETSLDTANKWEHQLLVTSFEEMKGSASDLTTKLLTRKVVTEDGVRSAIASNPGYEQLASSIEEMKLAGASVPAIAVLARQVKSFVAAA